jgi:AcrR family transcriptional regulator
MLKRDPAPAARTCRAHRERQRRRILDAAERLFDEHGVDRVAMAGITSASGLRASAVYRHFSNKDDIAWAIPGEVLADLAAQATEAIETAMTALDKITGGLLTLEAKLNLQGFGYFGALIREGLADGSLHPHRDPGLAMHAVINAVTGAQCRLASLGNRVGLDYGQPIGRLFRETIRVILHGLRSTGIRAVRVNTSGRNVTKEGTKSS